MIDCHCHILPGIDDGARDIDYALEMATTAVRNGIRTIVATPHHFNGVYVNSRSDILASVSKLNHRLAEENINLSILPGSELHLVPEILQALDDGSAMTYADLGHAVLLELPKHSIPRGAEQILENIIYRGYTPVIAHPERNTELRRHRNRIAEWESMGCYFQVTTNSCTGEFGSNIQSITRYWCERGWVHLVASDAHRVNGRGPDLRAGAEEIMDWVGEEQAKVILDINPTSLINGAKLQKISGLRPKGVKAKKPSLLGKILGRKKGL